MNNAELIAEARRQARSSTYPESPTYINTLIHALAEALESVEVERDALAVEWGNVTVDAPDAVQVTSEAKAFKDVHTWNMMRSVREGRTPRAAVVTRMISNWAITEDGE
ncbi:hypothetical protein E3T54_02995 [Cryobacterium sp. Sr8]|uniref:hypothetical protein n=1 Tax=Cryobacterium sp. Sr8 TaxID=1259203 RepID=UPI00106AC271|nr:hypothetical protein [Cryobacterium sp. Sr8]TFD80724.1 hypothetical protein E3T54_02995 [Cryobacterium sp. Sr8]